MSFSLIGAVTCCRWARELYGVEAGLLALGLWCFCPNILANAQMITPDAGLTALTITAAYAFWCWLKEPSLVNTVSAGLWLGLAQLAKAYSAILLGLWPALWIVSRFSSCGQLGSRGWLRQCAQLFGMAAVSLCVINLGYGFEGSFAELGDYQFVSRTFAGLQGQDQSPAIGKGHNRFRDTALGRIRVPLPRNYVLGIDTQKRSVEMKQLAYLAGEWKHGGWWFYYAYAVCVKMPLATLGLVFCALLLKLRDTRYSACRLAELVLLCHALAFFVFISSQTGVNRHFRYILPSLPFLYVWLSSLAKSFKTKQLNAARFTAIAFAWWCASSLWIYPHSLSYFNELAGGPKGGPEHLLDSNIDWGQDLLYLKRWIAQHPEAKPLHFAYGRWYVDPQLLGVDSPRIRIWPRSGWYAISVNELHEPGGGYDLFRKLKPVATAGYSIYIYRLTRADISSRKGSSG